MERPYGCALRLIGGNDDPEHGERFLSGTAGMQNEAAKIGNCATPTAFGDIQADRCGGPYKLIRASKRAGATKGVSEHGTAPCDMFSHLSNS